MQCCIFLININSSVRRSPWSAAKQLTGYRTRNLLKRPVLKPSRKTDLTQNCAPGRQCNQLLPVFSPRTQEVLRHACQPPPPSLPNKAIHIYDELHPCTNCNYLARVSTRSSSGSEGHPQSPVLTQQQQLGQQEMWNMEHHGVQL